MIFNIILEPDEDGGFSVTVPALDGCFTQGETEQEAIENAKEAILCYLEGLRETQILRNAYETIQEYKNGLTKKGTVMDLVKDLEEAIK